MDNLKARAYTGSRLDRVAEALVEDGPRQKQQGWSFVKQVVSEDQEGFTMVALYERSDASANHPSASEQALSTGAKRSAPEELVLGLLAIGSWLLLAASLVLVVIAVYNGWGLIAAIISVVALPVTALVGPFVVGIALGSWLALGLMLAGWAARFIPARVIAREREDQVALRELIAEAVLNPVLVDERPESPAPFSTAGDVNSESRSSPPTLAATSNASMARQLTAQPGANEVVESPPAVGTTRQPTGDRPMVRDRVLWRGLPWAPGTVPSPSDVARHADAILTWNVEGNAEQTPIGIGDRYWWDYGQAYRRFAAPERGLLVALADGVSLAAARHPALEELRWRLHSGVLLGEFRLVAAAADQGATKNSALKEVFEFITSTYVGPDSRASDGNHLVAGPELNEALSGQQTGAVVQRVWAALPGITQQHAAAALAGAPAS